jgi:hypothetical protein
MIVLPGSATLASPYQVQYQPMQTTADDAGSVSMIIDFLQIRLGSDFGSNI